MFLKLYRILLLLNLALNKNKFAKTQVVKCTVDISHRKKGGFQIAYK